MELIQLLPDIILAAGPFFIFGGMGTGTQSGKLKFKQICSGDSTISINNSINNLSIQSFGGIATCALPSGEIAYGTGTGINSGFACVKYGNTIVGVSSIGTQTFSAGWGVCDPNGIPTVYNSMIVNSYNVDNLNYASRNSNIIESSGSKLVYADCSNIIKGFDSKSCCSKNSTIITDCLSNLCASHATTILGGVSTCALDTKNSTIISGRGNIIKSLKTGDYTCDHSIISSYGSCIYSISNLDLEDLNIANSIISSTSSSIRHSNSGLGTGNKILEDKIQLGYNSIISSSKSNIHGGRCKSPVIGEPRLVLNGDASTSKNYTRGSDTSSVISSICSVLYDTCSSSIISSNLSCIYVGLNGLTSSYNSSRICSSAIVAGSNNKIFTYLNTENSQNYERFINNSGIISSKCSSIGFLSSNVSIINSYKAVALCQCDVKLSSCLCNSTLIGVKTSNPNKFINNKNVAILNSCFTKGGIFDSCNSVIMNSFEESSTYISGSCNSVIATSKNAYMKNVCNSVILSSGVGKHIMKNSDSSVMISGDSNYIEANKSVILSGICNIVTGTVDSSVIFSGTGNKITTNNSAILSGCSNLISSSNSSIIGGNQNKVCRGYSSVIGGYKNSVNATASSIIGSDSKTLTSFNCTTYVSKLIADLPLIVGFPGLTGSTKNICSPFQFSVNSGVVTSV